jgi:hypothetical protein
MSLFFVVPIALVTVAVVLLLVNFSSIENSRRLQTVRGRFGHHTTSPGESELDNKKDCNGKLYSELKAAYLENGYSVFRSCSISPDVLNAASAYTGAITTGRVGDAFITEDSVLQIATDPDTMEFLGYINSRGAFPFQTLNFPVATQQPTHSDVIHFDTLPTRGLMTAAWVALEDIHPDSGPLIYYPGSHKLGLWDVDELGVRLETNSVTAGDTTRSIYERKLQDAIDNLQLQPAYGLLKKGETFVWAASLLHGGSKLNDPKLTRRSQVCLTSLFACFHFHFCLIELTQTTDSGNSLLPCWCKEVLGPLEKYFFVG